MEARESHDFEFDVAISFASEDRPVADQIAKLLTEQGIKVFYDKYEEANLWGVVSQVKSITYPETPIISIQLNPSQSFSIPIDPSPFAYKTRTRKNPYRPKLPPLANAKTT